MPRVRYVSGNNWRLNPYPVGWRVVLTTSYDEQAVKELKIEGTELYAIKKEEVARQLSDKINRRASQLRQQDPTIRRKPPRPELYGKTPKKKKRT